MKETCTRIQDRLAEYVYGGLHPKARAAVAEHLAACPQCTDRVRALKDEGAAVRQLVAGLDADMEGRLSKVRQRLQAEPSVMQLDEFGLWQRFTRTRVTRLGAAAAVLFVGLLLLMRLGDGPLTLSNRALAQVAEAMNNVPWVHLQTTIVMAGKTTQHESWVSNPLQISASKEMDGQICWFESAGRRRAVYHPGRNTVIISYASHTSTGNVIDPSSPINVFRKQHGIGDTVVTCEQGQHNGIDADVYQAIHYGGRGGQRYLRSRHRLVTDRNKHLILVSEQYYYDPDGTVLNSDSTCWDYPAAGPTSMYGIGVPRSAQVLDFSPTRELLDILDQYEAKRDSFPARYIALVQYSRYDSTAQLYMVEGLDLFYSNEALKLADNLRFHPIEQKEFAAQYGDSFETLMDWWEHRRSGSMAVEWHGVSLYDDEYNYSTNTGSDGSWQPLRKYYSRVTKDRQLLQFGGPSCIYGDVLAELGYPMRLLGRYHQEPTRISLLQNDYAKDNACICLELYYEGEIYRYASGGSTTVVLPKRSLFYLDPKRDYFCRREEVRYDFDASWPVDPNWRGDRGPGVLQSNPAFLDEAGVQSSIVHGVTRAVMVRDVPEYDRTDNGRWYPKKIVTHTHTELYDGTVAERQFITTIHLNTNPTFPNGTFDPGQLPK